MSPIAHGCWLAAARRLAIGVLLLAVAARAAMAEPIAVGSKKFTESVILGEMATVLLRDAGLAAVHRRELGGTRVLWQALIRGDIDVYPEYTGTLRQEILAGALEGRIGVDALEQALRAHGLRMGPPLGFDNTYALGMRRARAQALGIGTISDLAAHPDLVLGFSNEFMNRVDGWPGLRRRYGLPQSARGLDHDLAYRGLAAGSLDVIDLYATDAEIRYYDIAVLADDLGFFPSYAAVWLYRADLPAAAVAALQRLAGRLDAPTMVALNAAVKLDRRPEAEVARAFLAAELGAQARARGEGLGERLLRRTGEHLFLVGVSLGAAILVAIPLGILAARRRRLGQVVLGAAGILQTIPSLALLVVMIPLLGIGATPAIVALFLYSLLPIVRNTYLGIAGIDQALIESADALGLPRSARLRRIELPLAMRAILSGIKTSAVINVGTATLGALIGAGGYGQPILTGIRLDDTALILEGAIPAALLALLVQGGLDLLERAVVPRGLRR